MDPVPDEAKAKRELMEKHITEIIALKQQVSVKRRQLKAMGLNDEPELKAKLIKFPEAQVYYQKKKQEAKTKKDTKATEKPAEEKPVTTVVPSDSPFIDPNAKPTPKAEPAPTKSNPVPAPAPAPAKPTPAPTPVQAPTPAPAPAPAKPTHMPTKSVSAPIPIPIVNRASLVGQKWF